MIKKTITAKALRENLREVITDINTNNVEYILEYVKGLKVKLSTIEADNKVTKFQKYLNKRKLKSNPNYKPFSNDELRKIVYDK